MMLNRARRETQDKRHQSQVATDTRLTSTGKPREPAVIGELAFSVDTCASDYEIVESDLACVDSDFDVETATPDALWHCAPQEPLTLSTCQDAVPNASEAVLPLTEIPAWVQSVCVCAYYHYFY